MQSKVMCCAVQLIGVLAVASDSCLAADDDKVAAWIHEIDSSVFTAEEAKQRELSSSWSRDIRSRRVAANQRETQAWRAVKSREDWERLRDDRLKRLRESLGQFGDPPSNLHVRVTRTLSGDGYRIENLIFESRPGLFVTANLYSPTERPAKAMPGILICHSHHNPKSEGELQDMGQLWARAGCLVLVMDQLGHGERRTHPFLTAEDYAGSFRPSRQDYYFRFNEGMQLHVIGDSLIGWMAWDLMRGVDVLLSRPGIDKTKIALLGSVAGGGDPCAVTAAIDRRIAAAVPFNFGGPQPETTFPLPDDAEASFNFAGGGSWESTRNISFSARDGFLPWVIVGAIAPRGLVYAHEFKWDQDRDPVWKRLETIFGFYDARNRLASTRGDGSVRGTGAGNTHCNNIGAVHRQAGIDQAFQQWFGIQPPEREMQDRKSAAELQCWTDELKSELAPRPLHALADAIGVERAKLARERLLKLPLAYRAARLRADWAKLLGNVEPSGKLEVVKSGQERMSLGDNGPSVVIDRIALDSDAGVVLPLLLLSQSSAGNAQSAPRRSVVVAFAQAGKSAFLRQRANEIGELMKAGIAVCLPDLRGIGETRVEDDNSSRNSASTSLSSSELMLGQTAIGSRLRDLRNVLKYLRTRPDIDASRMALWGDSFAPPNSETTNFAVPHDAEKRPMSSQPMGELVALFGGLFEPDVRAIATRGGLTTFRAWHQSPFCYLPHDCVIPGALPAGDLTDIAVALPPRSLRIDTPVDGLNREVIQTVLRSQFEPDRLAYQTTSLDTAEISSKSVVRWLAEKLNTAKSADEK